MYSLLNKKARLFFLRLIVIISGFIILLSSDAYSQIYVCANYTSFTKESNNEYDMGSVFCDFTFSVQIVQSGAGSIYAYGPVCPSGIGCGSSLKKFFYNVQWNANYSGPITIIVRRQRKAGLDCHNDGGNDEIFRDEYYKEGPYGNYSFGNLKLNDLSTTTINVIKQAGGTVKLSWDRGSSLYKINKMRAVFTDGSYLESGLTTPGDINYALNPIYLPRSTEGSYFVSVQLISECGGMYTWGNAYINVMPTCANDPAPGGPPYTNIIDVAGVSPTINPIEVDGGYNDNALWKEGGGYEVEQNTTDNPRNYRIIFSNVTDFGSYYSVSPNGALSDITYTQNGNVVDFKVNKDMGWYEFNITPKASNVTSYCRAYPNLNVFVGGRNRTFEEDCIITLPQYLIAKGVAGADGTLLHFRSTVISSQAVITMPGIILMDGAELKIDEVDPDPALDTDKIINYTYAKTYDDYGRVTGESRVYFDDMGRPTQSQVKNLTSKVVLASEQLYDKLGRPAISTLVAPVYAPVSTLNNCGLTADPWENLEFDYNPNFVVKQDGGKYDYTAFDNYQTNTAIENNPLPVGQSTAGTLGWYYSNNNTSASSSALKEPYVPVTAYPYSRVLYDDKGTNLVKGSASPGDQHRAGAGHVELIDKVAVTSDDDVWLTRYLGIRNSVIGYTTSLAQFKSSLYKIISTDTEGRQSIGYINKEDQQIISLFVPTPDEASFVFYDDMGRMRFSLSSNGIKQYFGLGEYSTPVGFSAIDKSENIYNSRGWLLESREKDGGITKFMYRKDGSVRFSQNQEQAITGKFSYTNYDKAGRGIEVGEFIPATGSGLEVNFGYTNTSLKSILEYGAVNHDLSDNSKGSKADWLKYHYDFPDPLGIQDAEFTLGNIAFTENEAGTKSWYSFDERARVIKVKKEIPALGQKIIDYKYDAQGNVKEVAYQRDATDAYYHYYEYTAGGELLSAYSGTVAPVYNLQNEIQNKTSLILQAKYTYYKHGPLKRVEIREGLQGLDYVYTIQGWLKSINHHDSDKNNDPGRDDNDLFGMTLEYFAGDYQKNNIGNVAGLTNTQNYNGNIRAMNWYSKKGSSTVSVMPTTYAYEYDSKDQLVNATWNTLNLSTNTISSSGNSYREGNMVYDANGNIKGLGRWDGSGTLVNDFLPTGSSGNLTYKFNYALNSNKLNSVTGYSTYTHNSIGQIKGIQSQASAKNMQLSYGIDGVTEEVNITGDPNLSKVRFTYDEDGNRVRKEVFNNLGQLAQETFNVYDASGNVISTYFKDISTNAISQNELYVYGSSILGSAYLSGTTYQYIYNICDHLGNTRVRFSKNGNNPKEEAFYDYYPYGELISDRNSKGSNVTNREYQGVYAEKDAETGFNAFQLRMYDPIVGRWMGPDPYRQYYSSYIGMGNNPVSGTDPDGGYSRFGAFWRNIAYGGEGVVKNDQREPGNQYGYSISSLYDDPEADMRGVIVVNQYGDVRTPSTSINVEYAKKMAKGYQHRFYGGELESPMIDPIDFAVGLRSSAYKFGIGFTAKGAGSLVRLLYNTGRVGVGIGKTEFTFMYRKSIAIGFSARYVGTRQFALDWHTLPKHGYKNIPKLHLHYAQKGTWSIEHHIDVFKLIQNSKKYNVTFKQFKQGLPEVGFKRTNLYKALDQSKILNQ